MCLCLPVPILKAGREKRTNVYFLRIQACSRCFTYMSSFHPHTSVRQRSLPWFWRWGNRGSEELSHFRRRTASAWQSLVQTRSVYTSSVCWLYCVKAPWQEHSRPPGYLWISFLRACHLLRSDRPRVMWFNAKSHVKENWTRCWKLRPTFRSKKKPVDC